MNYYITPKGKELLDESKLKKVAGVAALTTALIAGGTGGFKKSAGHKERAGAGISYQHAATPPRGSGVRGGMKGRLSTRRAKQARADAEGGPASVIRRLSPRGK